MCCNDILSQLSISGNENSKNGDDVTASPPLSWPPLPPCPLVDSRKPPGKADAVGVSSTQGAHNVSAASSQGSCARIVSPGPLEPAPWCLGMGATSPHRLKLKTGPDATPLPPSSQQGQILPSISSLTSSNLSHISFSITRRSM